MLPEYGKQLQTFFRGNFSKCGGGVLERRRAGLVDQFEESGKVAYQTGHIVLIVF
jgi:hypothetical protein